MTNNKLPAQACLDQSKKKGFTLTEIAIVLGIMGLILGAIWVAAAGVYNNQRINQGQTAILQTLQGIRTLYAQQATIGATGAAGDLTTAMVNAGVVPTNLIAGTQANPTMKTPWGQPMYIGNTADNLGVSIVVDGMSSALCVGLVSAIFGASHDRTLDNSSTVQAAAFANGNGPNALTGAYNASANPVSPTTGAAGTPGVTNGTTSCTANSNTNAARFVFGLQG